MTINDKIKQILFDKNLSPSYFADEIGVQRSSISHILSGRNRPSFDIIQKIIRRFPDLGYEWIMEEDSPSTASPGQVAYTNRTTGSTHPTSERLPERMPMSQPPTSYGTTPIGRSQRSEIPPLNAPTQLISESASLDTPSPPTPTLAVDKKVERILIFYTDGSFREYTPTL